MPRKKKGYRNGNGKDQIIGLRIEAENPGNYGSGRYVLFKETREGRYSPDGPSKCIAAIHAQIAGRKLTRATSYAKRSLISEATDKSLVMMIKKLEETNL